MGQRHRHACTVGWAAVSSSSCRGQLGIGVYSPLVNAKGNSVRGILLCRSLSERLGAAFLTVTRESRSAIGAIYDAAHGARVYELHGDLLFAGAEQAPRTIKRQREPFEAAILEVSRIDDINGSAGRMLAGVRATLSAVGKAGYLVDPDGKVVRNGREQDYGAIVFNSVDGAVVAAVGRLT